MDSSQSELDTLLDDALEGFDQAAGPRSVGAPATTTATAPGAAAAQDAGAGPYNSVAPVETVASSHGSGSGGAAGGSAPRGLAFDPLSRRPGPASRWPAAPPRAATGKSSSGGAGGSPASAPQDVDVLAEGLSQLLAELAKDAAEEEEAAAGEERCRAADGRSIGEQEAASGSRSGGQAVAAAQQAQGQQRDLHATLRALSEQAPSFAGSGEEPESEEELLRLLAQHLGTMGGGAVGADAAAAGAPPEMTSIVDTLMQQLLSKEVLYQPMKDIGDRYPPWLEANKDMLSPEDYQRYEHQYGYIKAICCLYETSPQNFPQLVDLLQQMQQCGQPPQEIVDELAPGMQFGPDGLPLFGSVKEGLPPELKDCVIQ